MKEEPVRHLSIYPSKLITLNSAPRSYDARPVTRSQAASPPKENLSSPGKSDIRLESSIAEAHLLRAAPISPEGTGSPRKG